MNDHSAYFLPGELIDKRYEIDDVKRGSMGVVYLCVDTKTQQWIALKTFQDSFLKTEESRQRFLEEALLWIELGKHPCVVQAYGLRLIHDKPYLVVERIQSSNPRGVTLKDAMFTQVLTLDFVLKSAMQICSAMNHAHNQFPDFVHGDLKPENVLIDEEQISKLSDFGIASHTRTIDNNASNLSPWDLATRMEGTPAFASPEQCRLQAMDTRSDIYSFGCILYQMLTKQVPFLRKEVAEYIHAHIHHTPKPPSELNNDVPHEVSELILRCLEKEPLRRYQSFQDLLEDLAEINRGIYDRHIEMFVSAEEFNFEERMERAWSFALVGRYEQAEEEFDAALNRFADHPEIQSHLTRYYFARQQFAKAHYHIKQALEAHSKDSNLVELFGMICLELRQYKEAETAYKRALSLNPRQISTYLELSRFYETQNKQKTREELLKTAWNKCNRDPAIADPLLTIMLNNKAFVNAKNLAQLTLESYPDHPVILVRMAQAHAATRDYRRAKESIYKAVQNRLESFDFWREVGDVYQQSGDYNQAYDAYNTALLYDGGDGTFYTNMAEMSLNLRRYDEAWRLTERAELMGADVVRLRDKISKKRFSM